MKNKFLPTALGLYINFFVHGMGVLILALNMGALSEQWSTDKAGVAIVISSLGIGRLLVLFVSGTLSDKFGRKPFVLLGVATYIMFFVGILLSPSVGVAYIFGIIAGMANSFLDAGTYPALMECFPKAKGSANVAIKAFISAGQFGLPLFIGFLVATGKWYGWSFILAITILVLNGIFIATRKFPAHTVEVKDATKTKSTNIFSDSSLWLDAVLFITYGYIAQSTFYLVSVWLKEFGVQVAGMEPAAAGTLMSYYAMGSLICVVITTVLVKKTVKPHQFLVLYTSISLGMLIVLWMFPTPMVATIAAFVIGFSAAGGVLQLGLTVMSEVFAGGKGMVTGVYYTAGSIASFTIPLVTAQLSKSGAQGISNIILLDVAIAAIGVVLAVLISMRYKKHAPRILATQEV